VAAQIGRDDPKRVAQRVDLGVPDVVIEGESMQQHHRQPLAAILEM
jgi:hypothetical protein